MATKLTYVDLIELENVEIDDKALVYLVKSGTSYTLRTINREQLQSLEKDPDTREDSYWPVSQETLKQLLQQDPPSSEIFTTENKGQTYQLKKGALTEKTVASLLKVDLKAAPTPFPKAKKAEQVPEWIDQILGQDGHEAQEAMPAADASSQRPYISPVLQRLAAFIHARNIQESQVQVQLQDILRSMAIYHLAHGETHLTRSVRGTYVHTLSPNASSRAARKAFASFLHTQAQPGVWGSYIEAEALADLFKIRLVVSDFDQSGALRAATVNYSPEAVRSPLIMQLHCHNYKHFSFAGAASTLGDGNCLYNSMAQFIYSSTVNFCPPAPKANPYALLPRMRQTFSNTKHNEEFKKAVAYQKELDAQFPHSAYPNYRENEAQRKAAIEALPSNEQEQVIAQIEADYVLALQMAQDEYKPKFNAQGAGKFPFGLGSLSKEFALKDMDLVDEAEDNRLAL